MAGQKVRRDDLKAIEAGPWNRKQTAKHFAARLVKLAVQREKYRARIQARLDAELAESDLVVTAVDRIGGGIPFEASGAVTYGGADLRFYFRYRGDFASLEIGHRDREAESLFGRPSVLIGDALLVCTRADVTGVPYNASLTEREAGNLLISMFGEAHRPQVGERYHERLTRAVDAMLADTGHDSRRVEAG